MYAFIIDDTRRGVWEYDVFQSLLAHLRARGLRVELRSQPAFEARVGPWRRKSVELSHNLAVLQQRLTRRYWVVDGGDWVLPFSDHVQAFAADRRCRGVLKCQWKPEPFRRAPMSKVLPWTYFETHALHFQSRLDERRAARGARTPLFFRGNVSWAGRRPILEELARRGLVNADFDVSHPYDAYLRELADHRLVLALEGFGNVCHREIEAFGLGVPVLMPVPVNTFHEPLVPDRHFVAVQAEAEREPPEQVADQLERRYREVIDDRAYLDAVAREALGWYERNVRFPASLDLALRLITRRPK
jgi:hypothetical protein